MNDALFVSSTDGALYDTRIADWNKLPPLRANYRLTHAHIETAADLKATLRAGSAAWPGGYPLYFITADGGALSFESVRAELANVLWAIANNERMGGWRVVACAINYEDSDLTCDHSGKRIESAYGEPDETDPDNGNQSLTIHENSGDW